MKDVNYLIQNGVDVKKSLELFGDINLYNETIVDFLNSIEEKIGNLEKYKQTGDMANYAIYAHSVKSDARYLGFTKLAEIAYKHELAGKANNYTEVCESYDEFTKEIHRIIDVVRFYNDGTKAKEEVHQVINGANTILVVDDSFVIRSFVQKIFADSVNVILASDGIEAINIIKTNKNIKAMLLDLNMPNCNGFQVLDFLKNNNLLSSLPVALITGEDDKDNINRAFSYGIIDLIQKPFNELNIKNTVTKLINLY